MSDRVTVALCLAWKIPETGRSVTRESKPVAKFMLLPSARGRAIGASIRSIRCVFVSDVGEVRLTDQFNNGIPLR